MQSSSITFHKLASNLIKEISINTVLFPILQSLFMQIILSAALTEVTVRQKQVLCYLNTALTYISPILRIQNNIDREPMLLNTAGKS